jgi:hypothetical protein
MGTKTADREHAKTYRSPFGRWDVTAPDFMAERVTTPSVASVPLRVVAEASPLRNIPGGRAPRTLSAGRAAARERAQRVVADATPKAPMTRTSVSTVAAPAARPRRTYAEVDAIAAKLPVGRYALPRTKASEAGNTVTFFEIRKVQGANRIVQLVGGVGDFTRQSLPLELQFFALLHIGEDITSAAALYGKEAHACGFCAARGRFSPLTNDRSRKAGYGEHCAKKHGLPW